MDRLNLLSFIFLVVVFVLAPRAALRSARQLRTAQSAGTVPPRLRMALTTMFSLSIFWALASINASAMGRSLFATPSLGLREVAIGVVAIGVLLLAIPISRLNRSPEEERRRLLYGFAPRNRREFGIFAVVVVMAGFAEEATYRGVAIWILAPIFDNTAPAIFLSAMAFAVAHAVQGGRTMAVIFAIALVFHAVVWLTNTLVIAIAAHIIYDLIAGLVAGRRAVQIAAADAATAPAPATV